MPPRGLEVLIGGPTSWKAGWHFRSCHMKGHPEGPSTQCIALLVPEAIPSMGSGSRDLKYWVLGPSWIHRSTKGPFVTGAFWVSGATVCLLSKSSSSPYIDNITELHISKELNNNGAGTQGNYKRRFLQAGPL